MGHAVKEEALGEREPITEDFSAPATPVTLSGADGSDTFARNKSGAGRWKLQARARGAAHEI